MPKQIEFSIDGEKHRAFAKHRLFVSMSEKGTLLFEHHDSTGESPESHGDPLHWTVSVSSKDKDQVVRALNSENAIQKHWDEEWELLNSIVAKEFAGSADYEAWLDNHDIPFRTFCKVF